MCRLCPPLNPPVPVDDVLIQSNDKIESIYQKCTYDDSGFILVLENLECP